MGRSRMIRYSVHVDAGAAGFQTTPMEYRVTKSINGPGYGKPTDANLARFIAGYMRALEPGGVNYHISQMHGFIPYPNHARIVDNRTGETVATYTAPMFMAVGGG